MRCLSLTFLLTLLLLVSCGESPTARSAREQKERDAKAQDVRTRFRATHPQARPFRSDEESLGNNRLTLEIQSDIENNPNQEYWVETPSIDVYRSANGHLVVSSKVGDDLIRLQCSDVQAKQIVSSRGHTFGTTFILLFSLTKAAPIRIEITAEAENDGDGPVGHPIASDILGRIYDGRLDDATLVEEGF
jgi:hypothetical protein